MRTFPSFSRPAFVLAVACLALAADVHAQTTVDGVIYASYRYGLTKDSTYAPAAAQNNFDIDRSYVSVRSKMENGVSSRITLDVDGRKASASQLSIRLKHAYVGWTPSGSALTWKFGLQGTPLVGWEDDLWGYRVQGPSPLDRNKYLSSADFGAAVEGAWNKQAVNFDAGIFNGETYSGAPGDNHKDLQGRVSVRLMETDNTGKGGGLRLTGFALIGKSNGGADRQRFLGMLSYQSSTTTLGVEYAIMKDSTAAAADTPGRLLSFFGTYDMKERPIGFMGRVDLLDPNTDVDPATAALASAEQTRVIAGAYYRISKNLKLLLDADVVSVQNGPAINTFEAANRSLYLHAEIKY